MTVVVQRLSFCAACTIASGALTSSGLMHREVTGGLFLPGSLPWMSTVVLISHLPGWTLTPAPPAPPAAWAAVALARRAAAPSSARVGRVGRMRCAPRARSLVWLAFLDCSRAVPRRGARAAHGHLPGGSLPPGPRAWAGNRRAA